MTKRGCNYKHRERVYNETGRWPAFDNVMRGASMTSYVGTRFWMESENRWSKVYRWNRAMRTPAKYRMRDSIEVNF